MTIYDEMEQLSKELNICFCGHGAHIYYNENITKDYKAECCFCGARRYGDSPQEAADAWNNMTFGDKRRKKK